MEEADRSEAPPAEVTAAAAPEAGEVTANQTIYINNLNDRVKKGQLRKSLYCAFSPFGMILDIVTMRTAKLRGQAWVVFDSIETASFAQREMDGSRFFGKEMGESRVVTIERNALGKK